jgi:hypothetical protein
MRIFIQDKEEIHNPGSILKAFRNALPLLPIESDEGNTPYFDLGLQK